MDIFYGAAIQGNRDRTERQAVHQSLIQTIKNAGYRVVSEHTTGSSFQQTAALLQASLGTLPPVGKDRTVFIRNRMIENIEGDIAAAIFEVSVPSLGTGIELAHAYLRSRLGLPEIPILALYEKDYWPNDLSSMVKGLAQDPFPRFYLREYHAVEEAEAFLTRFLRGECP